MSDQMTLRYRSVAERLPDGVQRGGDHDRLVRERAADAIVVHERVLVVADDGVRVLQDVAGEDADDLDRKSVV